MVIGDGTMHTRMVTEDTAILPTATTHMATTVATRTWYTVRTPHGNLKPENQDIDERVTRV